MSERIPMLRGRIGFAQGVHWIERYRLKDEWCVTLCGNSSGRCVPVKGEPVTCRDCMIEGAKPALDLREPGRWRWMEGTELVE